MAYCYRLQSCSPRGKDLGSFCLDYISTDINKTIFINGDTSTPYRLVFVGEDVCICEGELPPYQLGKECENPPNLYGFDMENIETKERRSALLPLEQTAVGVAVEVEEVKGYWVLNEIDENAKEPLILLGVYDKDKLEPKSYYVLQNCRNGELIEVSISGQLVAIGDVIRVQESKDCWTVLKVSRGSLIEWTLIAIYKDCQECGGVVGGDGDYFVIKDCATQKETTAEIQGGLLQVGDVFTVNENSNCYEILGASEIASEVFTFKHIYEDCTECLSSTSNFYRVKNCYSDEVNTVQILGGAVAVGDVITVCENNSGWIILAQVQGGVDTWTFTGKLKDCDECPEPSGDCVEDEERTIAYATMVRLPEPPIPDKGFKECCYTNLVLADESDGNKYKNDFTGFYFKKQTPSDDCEFILHELSTGDTYALDNGTYGDFKDFGSIAGQPNLTTYVVRWRKVLQVLGAGLYRIEKATTVAGLGFSEMSNTFTLDRFSDIRADKTVRLDAKMDGTMVHLGINFKGSDFETSIRTFGFFGRRDPKYKQDNLVKRNYDTVQISMSQENEYEMQTGLIPECITEQIYDFILFGNELFANDYNLINHSYKFRLYEVEFDSNKGGKYYNKIRDARLNLTFTDRVKNKRKINC